MSKKILVVDDEPSIVEIVRAYLEKDGFTVVTANDGRAALDMFHRDRPDLVVLDLMLPEFSGLDVCRHICNDSSTPVIMLTARDETTDKVVGLELGADDYVTKPFDPKELLSRIKAVLRRTEGHRIGPTILRVVGLEIDIEKRSVKREGETIDLTPFEFDLLRVLAEHPGRVFSRMELLDRVQGDAFDGYDRTIDSHVKNLRKKVEPDPNQPRYILTIYGVGYKLEEK